jgi:hypothetical protein
MNCAENSVGLVIALNPHYRTYREEHDIPLPDLNEKLSLRHENFRGL